MQNPFASPANQNQRPLSGRLAENIMHFARVLREVQGLDAAPGAQVERPADRLAHRELRQRGRRLADPQHVPRVHGRLPPVQP